MNLIHSASQGYENIFYFSLFHIPSFTTGTCSSQLFIFKFEREREIKEEREEENEKSGKEKKDEGERQKKPQNLLMIT